MQAIVVDGDHEDMVFYLDNSDIKRGYVSRDVIKGNIDGLQLGSVTRYTVIYYIYTISGAYILSQLTPLEAYNNGLIEDWLCVPYVKETK